MRSPTLPRRIPTVTTLLIVSLALFTLGPIHAAASPATDQHGEQRPWQGAEGRVTVIDFAASWCLPCVKSLPRLDRLAAAHPDVEFIVVAVDDKKAGRDRLVQDLELRLPVLWDEGYTISRHYEPEGMPTTIVLDSSGAEIHRHTGFSERQWQELVELVENHR